MGESILNALIHLFAIVANVNDEGVTAKGRRIVEAYLSRYLKSELIQEYLRLFDNYYEFYQRELDTEDVKDLKDNASLISFQIANVCGQIKTGLLRDERVIVFLQLLEFVYEDHHVTEQEFEFVKVVAKAFSLSDSEFNNFKSFIFEGEAEKLDQDKVLVIDNQLREWSDSIAWLMKKKNSQKQEPYKHLFRQNLYGKIVVFYIQSIQSFIFRYFGELSLYIEGQKIESGRPYFFNKGAIIKGPNIDSIYYYDIASKFILSSQENRINFSAENVEFYFRNSKNGIQKFNFSEQSGQMIAIMGGSGVGKSTLLDLLSGKLKPTKGKIKINGHNVHARSTSLTGLIGFVPQDDLLFEELTVFQNLYYNAKLCFSEFTEQQINEKVNSVLIDLDLYDSRDLQVGNPLNKLLSGGQRKRLNIGLELMREPMLLFVDEPTSGLSSMDSEKVMNLLKQQSHKGKLVIANIHQPSSEIFKLFDKLWIIDKGGHPIYQGNPVDAIEYFKTVTSLVNAAESECACCGTINPEQIFKIVEEKNIDEYGKETRIRKTSAETWYYRYIDNIEKKIEQKQSNDILPDSDFKIPNFIKQFKVFVMRNLLSKLTNKQYLLINLLEAPLLALILGFFTKYISPGGYLFGENRNFPVFLFMSVVVAIFLGLTVSAEEIIKDRKILERESFLKLSWFSYINSKLVMLFALSAIQTFLFTVIGNSILEISGMLFPFWIVLFSAACMGNLIGLNISSGLDSVIAIYILIPLILVPQLLLGGAMIHFDDLHESITNKEYVPLIGNVMTTRWAYEALAVQQFKSNKFEKIFFDDEQIISNADYKTGFLIPELKSKLEMCMRRIDSDSDSLGLVKDLKIIANEIELLSKNSELPFEYLQLLNPKDFNESVFEEAYYGYLGFTLEMNLKSEAKIANERRDSKYQEMIDDMGREEFVDFKQKHYNKKLADILLNRNEINKIYHSESRLIQKKDPVFMEPTSQFGRAHFYAPYKIIRGIKINTLLYNLIIMWLGTGLMFLALFGDVLRKGLKYIQSLNVRERWLERENRKKNLSATK
ncbi:MAG: ATP-binding cassette domain-containing protein [Bacteroidales bacterium]|nr:ATP-binding cassette domain-containing protein [Bacteroidales bacterium]